MPLVNYCKKCKAEVPNGETCPRCGAGLTKAGARLSFRTERTPVLDWFSWNGVLRVVVPVITLVLMISVLAEAVTEGPAGIANLFVQGFFGLLLLALGFTLALAALFFILQGRETVCYVLDQKGAHAHVYINKPTPIRLYARLTTPEAVEGLQVNGPVEPGLTYIRGVDIPWVEIRRAQYWPETATCLLYRPYWWQAMCIRCPLNAYSEAETFVRGKLSRKRKRKKRKK